jgi:hypothetical protein
MYRHRHNASKFANGCVGGSLFDQWSPAFGDIVVVGAEVQILAAEHWTISAT